MTPAALRAGATLARLRRPRRLRRADGRGLDPGPTWDLAAWARATRALTRDERYVLYAVACLGLTAGQGAEDLGQHSATGFKHLRKALAKVRAALTETDP